MTRPRRFVWRVWTACLVASAMSAACGLAAGEQTGTGSEGRAEPSAGTWSTWVLDSPEDVPVAPPPEADSAKAHAELRELATIAAERSQETLDAVEKWNREVPIEPWTRVSLEYTALGAKRVPLSSRNYALLHTAMYDAVVAAWFWKYEYNRAAPVAEGFEQLVSPGEDPSYPSEHAAIAGAASRVLAHVFPDRPAMRLEVMAEQAAETRIQAGVNTRSDVEAGLELGRAVADAVIARAKTDGPELEWDGTRPQHIGGGPDFWEPPPGSVARPDAPLAGTWDTWVVSDASMFRPPPPPEYGSPDFVAAAEELVSIKDDLTNDEQRIAKFWEGAEGTALPAGILIELTLGDVQAAGISTPYSTRALALLAVALHDGAIAVWDAKYAYWNPRPENAIRELGLDPDWSPFLPTPLFPAYPSGSAGYAGAAESVLSYLFPEEADRFRARAVEQAESRLYGGIHWRYDSVSLETGREIGNLVVERAKSDGSD